VSCLALLYLLRVTCIALVNYTIPVNYPYATLLHFPGAYRISAAQTNWGLRLFDLHPQNQLHTLEVHLQFECDFKFI